MTRARLSSTADLFERLGLVMGTGRKLAIDFSVGTLVAQDRKVSFDFKRELLETKATGPTTLIKIHLKPLGKDAVNLKPVAEGGGALPVDQTTDKLKDVPSLTEIPTPAVPSLSSQLLHDAPKADTTTQNTDVATNWTTAEDELVHEVKWDDVKGVPGGNLVSTSQEVPVPMLCLPWRRSETSEVIRRRLSPSTRDAYQRLLHDMKQNMMQDHKHLNVRRSIRTGSNDRARRIHRMQIDREADTHRHRLRYRCPLSGSVHTTILHCPYVALFHHSFKAMATRSTEKMSVKHTVDKALSRA